MSLIQDALAKTQSQFSVQPNIATAPAKPEVRPVKIGGLDAFDREVEKKLSEIEQKPTAVAPQRAYFATIAWLVTGALFIFGFFYWYSHQPKTETAPPLVVDIQKSTFVSKPQLAQTSAKDFVVLADSTDARGKYNLSGIAWGGDQPYALINGQIMRVGDKVERKVFVSKIEEEYVDLDYRGELVRLEIRR